MFSQRSAMPAFSPVQPVNELVKVCPFGHGSCGFLVEGVENIPFAIETSPIPNAGNGFWRQTPLTSKTVVGEYGGVSQCLLCHQALYVGPKAKKCE